MPKTLKPPDNLLEILTMHCQANDIGMAMMGSDEVGICLILMGRSDLSPDQASILAAGILLQGIISRSFHDENQEKIEEDEKSIPKEKIN